MRRIVVFGMLLAVGLALFTGCGAKDTGAPPSTEKPVQRLKKPGGV
jgi:hypothetical protein